MISNYLKKMGVPFDYLPDYLRKPAIYHGKSIGLEQIIEWFIDLTISKYYKKIQKKNLTIKYVINAVRENLFQGGWDPKKYSNIIRESKVVNNAQKVVNTIKIDDAPRLLIISIMTIKLGQNQKQIYPQKRKERKSKHLGKVEKVYANIVVRTLNAE